MMQVEARPSGDVRMASGFMPPQPMHRQHSGQGDGGGRPHSGQYPRDGPRRFPSHGDAPAAPAPPAYSGGGAYNSRGAHRVAAGGVSPTCVTAFVSNLPHSVTPEEVEMVFAPTIITDMRPIRHRDSGRLRGIFIDFENHELLLKALRKDGTVVRGRPVTVRPDMPSAPPVRPVSTLQQGMASGPPSSTPPTSLPTASPASSMRPKLNLAPRSAQAGAIGAQSSPACGRPNPFGDAKPANTSERLLELERLDNERKARREENERRRASLKAHTDAVVAHIAAGKSVMPTHGIPSSKAVVAPGQPPKAIRTPSGVLKPKPTADSWEDDEDDTEEDEDDDDPGRPDMHNPFSLLAIDDC